MEFRQIDISWTSLWRIVAMGALVFVLVYVRDVLVVLFIALIISSALHRPVEWLEKHKIPRVLSVLVIFLVAAAIIGLLLYAIVPIALIQLKYITTDIANLQVPFLENFIGADFVQSIDQSISQWVATFFYGGSNVVSVLESVVGNVILAFVTAVLTFYLSISKGSVERFIRAIMPLDKEVYVIGLYERTRRKLGKWLTSQLVLSFIVGAMTFAGMLLLGTEYTLIIAIIAMVLEIVPYVGPIATGVISFVLIMPQSISLAIIAVFIFFAIQQIENHILQPLIVGKAVGIDPMLVVIAILAGSQIGGLVGAILAIPAAIILQEAMDDWSIKKRENTNL